MKKVLISWVGRTDLQAADAKPEAGEGPVGQAVRGIHFDEVNLLCNYPKINNDKYVKWLKKRTSARIVPHQIKLTSPTNLVKFMSLA